MILSLPPPPLNVLDQTRSIPDNVGTTLPTTILLVNRIRSGQGSDTSSPLENRLPDPPRPYKYTRRSRIKGRCPSVILSTAVRLYSLSRFVKKTGGTGAGTLFHLDYLGRNTTSFKTDSKTVNVGLVRIGHMDH